MFSSNLLKMLEQLELVELTSILQTLFVRSQISHTSYSTVTSPQSQCPPDNLITFSLKYSLCCVQPLITQSHIVHFCPDGLNFLSQILPHLILHTMTVFFLLLSIRFLLTFVKWLFNIFSFLFHLPYLQWGQTIALHPHSASGWSEGTSTPYDRA